jgi:hypothetical protein
MAAAAAALAGRAATATATAAVTATAAATAAAPRPGPRAGAIAWPIPRLARRRRAAKPARSPAHRIAAFVVSLPDHSWLDRLVRGRSWIPVLGVLLAGIVATQVEILKLGASMGRAIEQTTSLTSTNEQLRSSVAMLSDDQRIERLASAMGMVLPPPGAVGYLPAGRNGNVSGALANLQSPNPSAFVSLTPKDGDGALVTGQGTSTLPPADGTVAPTVSTPSVTSDATASSAISATGATPSSTGATQSSTAASDSEPGTGTSTEAPATTSQAPAATTESPSTSSQTPTDTGGQTDSGAPTDETNQDSASGAAAIQPAGSDEQSSGG